MDGLELKAHPQKRFLRMISTILFYLGLGNCWYEDFKLTKTQIIIYRMWVVLANSFALIGYINELGGHYRSDLTNDEKRDLTIFNLAHTVFFVKIAIYLLNANRVKVLLKRFLDENREYASLKIDKASVKKAMIFCVVMTTVADGTTMSTIISGILTRNDKGKYTITNTTVTFYPTHSQSGLIPNTFRVLSVLWWWYTIFIINIIDCVVVSALVFLGSKFKYLQHYFSNLRVKFLQNPEWKSQNLLEEEFKRDFVIGIKLHAEALWCVRRVQHDFGHMYSILVLESIFLLVIPFLSLARADASGWDLIFVANVVFLVGVIVLTGTYMVAAGDMTYEAESLSTSIFHSGWDLNRTRTHLRTLMVVAIQMSQEPVFMTALGIVILSYENYIAIMRLSYSFFTLMYSVLN